MKYLFIGGPLDGQRLDIPDLLGDYVCDTPNGNGGIRREIYSRDVITGFTMGLPYFRHEEIEPTRACELLLEYYHPPQEAEPEKLTDQQRNPISPKTFADANIDILKGALRHIRDWDLSLGDTKKEEFIDGILKRVE